MIAQDDIFSLPNVRTPVGIDLRDHLLTRQLLFLPPYGELLREFVQNMDNDHGFLYTPSEVLLAVYDFDGHLSFHCRPEGGELKSFCMPSFDVFFAFFRSDFKELGESYDILELEQGDALVPKGSSRSYLKDGNWILKTEDDFVVQTESEWAFKVERRSMISLMEFLSCHLSLLDKHG